MRGVLTALAFVMIANIAEARPWCSASRLNPTERTICGDTYLRSLDERLQGVHDRAEAIDQIQGASTWLRDERNACGTRITCIENAYFSRIAVLQGRLDAQRTSAPTTQTRPWCSSSRLNLTERTVCGSAILTDLDALLQNVYDRANARGLASGQSQWLRDRRNACGADTLCLAGAYLDRISVLEDRMK